MAAMDPCDKLGCAGQAYGKGYTCAQAVFCAYAKDLGIDETTACLDPIVRSASAWLLGSLLGRRALWFAWPIGWGAALIVPAIGFLRGNWQKKLPIPTQPKKTGGGGSERSL